MCTRVVDDAVHKITIKNTGKYDALYQFFLRTDLIKELVTVTPDSGPLQPGESATIEVRCRQHRDTALHACCWHCGAQGMQSTPQQQCSSGLYPRCQWLWCCSL
jgi:hypothetical protein